MRATGTSDAYHVVMEHARDPRSGGQASASSLATITPEGGRRAGEGWGEGKEEERRDGFPPASPDRFVCASRPPPGTPRISLPRLVCVTPRAFEATGGSRRASQGVAAGIFSGGECPAFIGMPCIYL